MYDTDEMKEKMDDLLKIAERTGNGFSFKEECQKLGYNPHEVEFIIKAINSIRINYKHRVEVACKDIQLSKIGTLTWYATQPKCQMAVPIQRYVLGRLHAKKCETLYDFIKMPEEQRKELCREEWVTIQRNVENITHALFGKDMKDMEKLLFFSS